MIKDILYSFNKRDYFYYFFIFIGLFVLINKTDIINSTNIIHISAALLIFYLLLKNKINNDFSKMDLQNNKLKVINIDKYRYLKEDIYVVDCIIKLKHLSGINRVKFNEFMEHTNNFFKYYLASKSKNMKPTELYDSAKKYSHNALNTLLSFSIDLESYQYLSDDRELSEEEYSFNNNIEKCVEILKNRFNIYLSKIESKINTDWQNGDINIFSQPIYSDDVVNNTSDILFSNKFNMY